MDKKEFDINNAVLLGTPTATPPNWVEELNPDMMMLDESGRRYTHGGKWHNHNHIRGKIQPRYRAFGKA